MAGFHLTLAMTELNTAMRMAKLDTDFVNDANKKYDMMWKAYREARIKSKEGYK